MRRVRLIGIGSGHPDQLTVEAAEALRRSDFVIAADKGPDDPLLAIRNDLVAAHGGAPVVAVADPPRDRNDPVDYPGAVADWHAARAAAYEKVLLQRDGDAAFLVWGDPAFYDSTIRIVEQVHARGNVGFDWDVLPGVSSIQLLAARHRIVLHEVGRPITVTTGRKLLETVGAGGDNLVVMLSRELACRTLPGDAWRIWWGANLGTHDEVLVSGMLGDVLPEIDRARDQVKQRTGWVMDTYLLRRA